ncbi:MAG: SDR family oxidoreductase [Acidobacteriota bacterium]|nr:MAG: SDR family oxidoreductase [Acidobacteriota bacterium]
MHGKFKGKHAIVTGGARSIGFEIARQFCAAGAMVSIFDYNQEALEIATTTLTNEGYRVNPFLVDVSDQLQVNLAVDRAEEIAPVDVLVNNAGICLVTPFLNIEAEEWQKTLDTNLSGAFYVAQRVCRYMARRGKGVVLNMSSKNGLDGEFGHAHYNSSKAGLILLTKTIALELAHLGIRANAVCPGYIRTAMNTEVDSDEFVEEFEDRYIPGGRVGKVTDIAPIFLFLASDDAEYINGQTFVLDGGQLAGQKPWKWLLEEIKL